MENSELKKEPGMFNAALQYGVLIAIGLAMLTIIIYLADLQDITWLSFIGYAILLGGLILGTIKYRDEHLGGYISYSKALGFGTFTAFLTAVISAIFTYIFYTLIAPDALESLKEAAEIKVLQDYPNATDQQLDLTRAMVSPLLMTISALFGYTFLGFIFSLLTSAFFKKTDPLTE